MPTFDRDRVTATIRTIALRNEAALLIAARTVSHTEAARRLSLPKQTYQDWRDEYLKDALLALAAYGLKLVPHDAEAYLSEDIAAMSHLAQRGLLSIKPLRSNGGVVVDDDDTVPGSLE